MSNEQQLKATLDGKFFSFMHSGAGTTVKAKTVPPDYSPDYNFENPFITASKRGAWSRAQMRAEKSARIWTPENIAELVRLSTLGYGGKKIQKLTGISRGEVEGQQYRMGLRVKPGKGKPLE